MCLEPLACWSTLVTVVAKDLIYIHTNVHKTTAISLSYWQQIVHRWSELSKKRKREGMNGRRIPGRLLYQRNKKKYNEAVWVCHDGVWDFNDDDWGITQ